MSSKSRRKPPAIRTSDWSVPGHVFSVAVMIGAGGAYYEARCSCGWHSEPSVEGEFRSTWNQHLRACRIAAQRAGNPP